MISMHTSPLATPGVGDAGGLNVYVAEVARRLGERGVAVDIFTRRNDPELPDSIDAFENVRVCHVRAGAPGPLPKEQLPQLIDEFCDAIDDVAGGYDLLHSHYWLSGLAALQLGQRHGLPVAHTMHTMARVKNADRAGDDVREPNIREQGEAKIVRNAQVLTANTSDEAAQLAGHYGARPEQVVIVPPGVDLHVFHPCDQVFSRRLFKVDTESAVILFVGRIQRLKAPDVLISATAELLRRQPQRRGRLKLIIVGSPSGPDTAWAATLPELAKSLDVDDVVEFRPHSARDELFRWYCVADVVGVPSYNESFGLVALEAQACGRPVVATDVGGLRHAVRDQHTGLLVEGHDPVDWADALGQLLDESERVHQMRSAAAIHASRFSWDNSAAATLEGYHQAQLMR